MLVAILIVVSILLGIFSSLYFRRFVAARHVVIDAKKTTANEVQSMKIESARKHANSPDEKAASDFVKNFGGKER